jgi:hypothetical protein
LRYISFEIEAINVSCQSNKFTSPINGKNMVKQKSAKTDTEDKLYNLLSHIN